MHVASVIPLEGEIGEKAFTGAEEKLPFWTSLSLEELTDLQGVHPAEDLDSISALWPVDDDPDRMLTYILEERTARRGITRHGNDS